LPVGRYDVVASALNFKTRKESLSVIKGSAPPALVLKLDSNRPPDVGGEAPAKAEPPVVPAPAPPPAVDPAASPTTPAAKTDGVLVAEAPHNPSPKRSDDNAPLSPTFSARFITDEWGVEVSVDGRPIGKTPNAKAADLLLGIHKYTAHKVGFKPYAATFVSEAPGEIPVNFVLQPEGGPPRDTAVAKPAVRAPPPPKPKAFGRLACSSKPAGAQVWVDGVYQHRDTPISISNPLVVPVGKHDVVFKLKEAGTKSAAQKVEIKEDELAIIKGVEME
jgi:hypothetical protein